MSGFIYADNAATTKLDIDAYEAMKPFLLNDYSNPSQPYSYSRLAKKAIKEAREIIAKCINAKSDEIYFTSGGTESDNWALNGITFNNYSRGAIVTDNIEHHAILKTCESIEKRLYPVAYLSADKQGVVGIDKLKQVLSEDAKLVSIMLANNEIGTIQPIKKLCEYAHSKGVLFHTDAVQAVGHIPIDVQELGVDLLSASAHKFNGPKGIGFLYVRKGTEIAPYLNGGSQEYGLRAGTENVASIIGMAIALKKNVEMLTANMKYISHLEERFMELLSATGIDYIRNGAENHIPGNINISFKGMDGEMILHRLDLMGIMVSTGAACDTKETQVSHVLRAIGVPDDYVEGTIRISLSKYNNEDEVKSIVEAISKIVRQ